VNRMNLFRLHQVMAALLLAGIMVTLTLPPAFADGYQRVYNASTRQYNYVPRQRIEPYQQPTYQYEPEYQYRSYQSEPPRRTIAGKIRDGFKDLWQSPTIKKGVMGAGIGLGAAALTERHLGRGSLIGLGVGAGVGAMDESRYFSRHPLVRRTGKGALVGVGAAAATGAAALLPAAAVGAGIGAGIHYIKTH
jgi:hypothetical protein